MAKTIAIHSYKGGTGKSFIAANVALIYASKGYKTSLLDFDFRAPSVQSIFEVEQKKNFINNFLEGGCEIQDALVDVSDKFNTKGKLFVGLADRSIEGMTREVIRDRRWQMNALSRMTSAIRTMRENLGFEHIIFDTSPGFHYSSINALLASEAAFLITTLDKSDYEGTIDLVRGIYRTLERKTGMIINKIPKTLLESPDKMTRILEEAKIYYRFPVIEALPCDCDILSMKGEAIFSFRQPNHPMTESLMKLAKKIDAF